VANVANVTEFFSPLVFIVEVRWGRLFLSAEVVRFASFLSEKTLPPGQWLVSFQYF